jgi:phage/plasmid-like protein (TIGR03299 family)
VNFNLTFFEEYIMAHELSFAANGTAEMAYIGAQPWHGLGNELEQGASIEKWIESAGMAWKIREAGVQYIANDTLRNFDGKKVLYREDSGVSLGVVSNAYMPVQPASVLEFFRDLVENNDMTLSTAGVLFGGKKLWALAELGKEMTLSSGDVVRGNLLLTTACDGSSSTVAKFVSTRVVCNNTLSIAMSESKSNIIKQTHHREFDARSMKMNLGVIDESWNALANNIVYLSEAKASDSDARLFFEKLVYDKSKSNDDQTWGATRKVGVLMEKYRNGIGADMSRGTKWGILNAITELETHGSGKRDASHQFNSSLFGAGDAIKSKVFAELLAA